MLGTQRDEYEKQVEQLKAHVDILRGLESGETIKKLERLTDLEKALEEKSDQLQKTTTELQQLKSMNTEAELAKTQQALQTTQTSNAQLAERIEQIQRDYFFSLAVALKLDRAVKSDVINFDTQALYERALEQKIPHNKWATYVGLQVKEIMDKLEEERRETMSTSTSISIRSTTSTASTTSSMRSKWGSPKLGFTFGSPSKRG